MMSCGAVFIMDGSMKKITGMSAKPLMPVTLNMSLPGRMYKKPSGSVEDQIGLVMVKE